VLFRSSSHVVPSMDFVMDEPSFLAAKSWLEKQSGPLGRKSGKISDVLKILDPLDVTILTNFIDSSVPASMANPNASTTPPPPPAVAAIPLVRPVIFDFRLMFRLAVLLVIISHSSAIDYSDGRSILFLMLTALGCFVYYLFETGILKYCYHLIFRPVASVHQNTPNLATPVGGHIQPTSSMGIAVRGWSRLKQYLLSFLQVPRSNGVLLDGFSLAMCFFMSLFPNWTPDGLNAP